MNTTVMDAFEEAVQAEKAQRVQTDNTTRTAKSGCTMVEYSAKAVAVFGETRVNELYKYDWSFARLHDEFGSLQYLEIIENQ